MRPFVQQGRRRLEPQLARSSRSVKNDRCALSLGAIEPHPSAQSPSGRTGVLRDAFIFPSCGEAGRIVFALRQVLPFFRIAGYDARMGEAGLSAPHAILARTAKRRSARNEMAIKPLKIQDCETSWISSAYDFSAFRSRLRSGSFRSAKAPFRFGADVVGDCVDPARLVGIGFPVGAC